MAIFDDLQYCKSSKRWVGLKKSKHDDVILEWPLRYELAAEIVSKIQDNKQCALMVRYSLLFAQRDLKSVEQSAAHNGAKSFMNSHLIIFILL